MNALRVVARMLRCLVKVIWWSFSGPRRALFVGGPLVVAASIAVWGWKAVTVLGTAAVCAGATTYLLRDRLRIRSWAHCLSLTNREGRSPRVIRARRVPGGRALDLRLPVGLAALAVEANKDQIAAAYRAESVTVRTLGPGKVRVTVTKLDPLTHSCTSPWLTVGSSDTRTKPVEVGRTASGEGACVNLFSTSILIGGNPGSGKSATMTNIVTALALDPATDLYLVDAKGGVELRQWEACATGFADTLEAATPLLEDVLARTQSRFEVLRDAGLKKWRPEDGSIALVIDELAEITGTGSKSSKDAAETLRRIIALGRAAGVTVVAATQKPDSTTVPTAIRDMMAQRIGLRCGARGQADVIIPELGEELTKIPLGLPGVGYITNNQGGYERMRAYFIPDDAVPGLAERAAQRRSEHAHAG